MSAATMKSGCESLSPSTSTALVPALKPSQLVIFDSENEEWTTSINGEYVEVQSRDNDLVGGSWSKVRMKLRSLVDYNWEQKIYHGNPLAVHSEQQFYAYTVKGPRSTGCNGMVRVGHKSTDKRALIKGMEGMIHDLAFAYIEDQIILATIDETGSLYIHKIELSTDGIQFSLLLKVENKDASGTQHRVIWCPFVPDEEDNDAEEDCSKLLITTHDNKACIWNINTLVAKYGEGHTITDSSKDSATILEHTQPIVDASISPDGTTLATASQDGYVMFFQICLYEETPPKCIHRWTPHDGVPLSCLFFLDKHTNVADQFWKYAVTGSLNNTVLKVWCCKTWTCIQTFSFDSFTKPTLDKTASYLILSDIYKKAIYILHFQNDPSKPTLYCNNITFFHVPYPVLCIGITETCIKVAKCPTSCDDLYHISKSCSPSDSPIDDEANEDEDESIYLPYDDNMVLDNSCNIRTFIKLYLMQTKSLQEASISYVQSKSQYSCDLTTIQKISEPKTDDNKNSKNITDSSIMNQTPHNNIMSPKTNNNDNDDPIGILAQQSQTLKNFLLRPQVQSSNSNKDNPSSPLSELSALPPINIQTTGNVIPVPLNLMTPDAFSSSKRSDDLSNVRSPDKKKAESPVIPYPIAMENSPAMAKTRSPASAHGFTPTTGHTNQPDGKLASGGSSPSREVQEIMSLKGSDCFYEDDIDDEINSQSSNHVENMNSPTVTKSEGFQLYNPKKDDTLSSKSLDNNSTWPAIDLEKINEANQRRANSEKPISQNRNSNQSHISTSLDIKDNFDNHASYLNDENIKKMMPQVSEIEYQLGKVIEYNAEQQKEVNMLRHEISVMKKNAAHYQSNSSHDSLQEVLQKQKIEIKEIVESAIAKKIEEDRRNQKNLICTISQLIDDRIKSTLNEAIAQETQTTVVKCIEKALGVINVNLKVEMGKKITEMESAMNLNLQKLFNSKVFLNKISMAVTNATTTSSKETFKQIVQSDLVPNMEKAQAQMLKQLNTSFSSGTKEYIAAFEKYTKKSLEKCDSIEEAHLKINNLTVQLQQIIDQQNKQNALNSKYAQNMKQLNNLSKEIHTIIPQSVQGALEQQMSPLREIIREQISSANAEVLGDFMVAMRSQSQTPAPIVDTQMIRCQIDHHISVGEINAAFQKALSASDLKLLAYTMSSVDPHQVFTTPCSLQQNVLLSLIQQLGADMEGNSALKQKYLKKAVLSLDYTNSVTKEHMPAILRSLQEQLSLYMETHPSSDTTSNLFMLNLAIDGMLKRVQ